MPAIAKKTRAWERPKTTTLASVPTAPTNSNFAPIIDKYARLDSQIKELEKSKKTLGEQIRALGEGEHNGTCCKVVVQLIPTTRLDAELLRGTLPPELLEKCSKTSTTTKISIKALV